MARYPRLAGLPSAALERVTCRICYGSGQHGEDRTGAALGCQACRATGLVCPTCRGTAYIRTAAPAGGATRVDGLIARCPTCATLEALNAAIVGYLQHGGTL